MNIFNFLIRLTRRNLEMKLVYGLGFSGYESDSLESCPRYLQVIHRSAKSLIG